ncbi:MAG: 50S ribosomal protein L28 [Parcubacteria group bacterium]|nr:50S ribosomal protein L28 [Parcubacteria group bacterium]
MARCEKCRRGSLNVNSRSHSNVATKRRQKVNLQKKTIDGTRVKICTKCIKTMNKEARE